MTYRLHLTIRGDALPPITVDADRNQLGQAVHRHARGHLGSSRVDIHLHDDGLTGTITSHGADAGDFTLATDAEPTDEPVTAAEGIRGGWTLRTLDQLARTVVSNNRTWWPAGDRDDLYAAAWHGIVEHLYGAAELPSRISLMEAGRRALADDVRDTMRHHGARRDGTNNGQKYALYWQWAGRAVPSPEGRIVDEMALWQILPTLTAGQRAALDALAATGDYAEAARLLGIHKKSIDSQLMLARRRFRALWHEGEEPSAHWGCDRRAGSTVGTVGGGTAMGRIRRRGRDRQAREAAA